jgi:hypothetical protein
MRRGALTARQRRRRADIGVALQARGVPTALADRMAFQFVAKFRDDELGDHAVWSAVGTILHCETARLRHYLGLAERQIARVLPKLSARQVEDFLDELYASDRRIARTIFDAAIDAATPIATGRRYLTEYRFLAEELEALDPSMARTLANACFAATAPRRKAMAHIRRFAKLLRRFDHDVKFARMLAKAAFRASDPTKAAEDFVAGYGAVIESLTASGVDPEVARTLAKSTRFRSAFSDAMPDRNNATQSPTAGSPPRRRRVIW